MLVATLRPLPASYTGPDRNRYRIRPLPGQSENCLNTSPVDRISSGRPLKRQISLLLDPDLIAFADAQARLNHVSRGHYIRSLIRREQELNTCPSWKKPIQDLLNDAPLIL